ncbi:MAG: TonB-dependent receptor [Alphaproteobacteria bacterium]|uniref:TonB-dependent receptor n=1 Tax=Candidatus Nitrobium versatile TaxID=2884831 RepID=A0A953JC96_9BACT|nr:TonB-dependent receptor [Candidatus Nitrobium versatile]
MFLRRGVLFLLACALMIAVPVHAFAEAEHGAAKGPDEKEYLWMFFSEELLVYSATRSPKPIVQVPENVSLVTAEEIELMHAHTLADVLNTVVGVQIQANGGPGAISTIYIQGGGPSHVTVYLDEVRMNSASDNLMEVGSVPVTMIEKIEIIKGPASSVWGSALGGVINVITKSGNTTKTLRGSFTSSFGEQDTRHLTGELYGKLNNFSYYLNAERFRSGGLTTNSALSQGNLYAKFRYRPSDALGLTFSTSYNKGDREAGQYEPFDLSFRNGLKYFFATLSLDYRFSNTLTLDVSLSSLEQIVRNYNDQLSSDIQLSEAVYDNRSQGADVKMVYKEGIHNLVFGLDREARTLKSNVVADSKQDQFRWAVFLNDTLTLGRFSLVPGLRYDYSDTNGDFISPSFGLTYRITSDILLRGYVARGFNLPTLFATYGDNLLYRSNPDLEMEKVWSYQAGIETTALQYALLKVSLFRHDVSNALDTERVSSSSFTTVNKGHQRRQGVEAEARTVPFHYFSFFVGGTFVDAEDRDTGETLKNIPRYVYDFGVRYDDENTLKALLKGRYLWWNAEPFYAAKYNSFIVDLNLQKTVYLGREHAVALFVTGHNLFNGSQYWISAYKNPSRWWEAGLKYRF